MPKGNLLKQNLPKGVINAVNRQESSDNGIYQNPLFASNLVNTVAPASLPKVSSTEGYGVYIYIAQLASLSFCLYEHAHTDILTPRYSNQREIKSSLCSTSGFWLTILKCHNSGTEWTLS